MKYIPLISLVMISMQASADIKVVYGDNTIDNKDIRNVVEVRNAFESQISELEIRHKQEQSEIQTKAQFELEQEQARAQAILNQKESEIAKKEKLLSEFQQKEEERKRKEREAQKVNKDYKLSADLTKRVITHIGLMPSVLPASSSEGVDAPLAAAFNSLIPMDWKVFVHQSISDNARIGWLAANENWVATLYKIGVRYGYSFNINWDERWIMVNRSELKFGSTEPVNERVKIMGSNEPLGAEGYMLIDGKIMKVRRSN